MDLSPLSQEAYPLWSSNQLSAPFVDGDEQLLPWVQALADDLSMVSWCGARPFLVRCSPAQLAFFVHQLVPSIGTCLNPAARKEQPELDKAYNTLLQACVPCLLPHQRRLSPSDGDERWTWDHTDPLHRADRFRPGTDSLCLLGDEGPHHLKVYRDLLALSTTTGRGIRSRDKQGRQYLCLPSDLNAPRRGDCLVWALVALTYIAHGIQLTVRTVRRFLAAFLVDSRLLHAFLEDDSITAFYTSFQDCVNSAPSTLRGLGVTQLPTQSPPDHTLAAVRDAIALTEQEAGRNGSVELDGNLIPVVYQALCSVHRLRPLPFRVGRVQDIAQRMAQLGSADSPVLPTPELWVVIGTGHGVPALLASPAHEVFRTCFTPHGEARELPRELLLASCPLPPNPPPLPSDPSPVGQAAHPIVPIAAPRGQPDDITAGRATPRQPVPDITDRPDGAGGGQDNLDYVDSSPRGQCDNAGFNCGSAADTDDRPVVSLIDGDPGRHQPSTDAPSQLEPVSSTTRAPDAPDPAAAATPNRASGPTPVPTGARALTAGGGPPPLVLPPLDPACIPSGIQLVPGDVVLFTDGANRNNGTCSIRNPAQMGWGFVVCDHQLRVLRQGGGYEGSCTKPHDRNFSNNVAEYLGLQAGLQAIIQLQLHCDPTASRLLVFGDSQLVKTQLRGVACARGHLQGLLRETQASVAALHPLEVSFHHVLRGSNKRADALANAAINRRSTYVWDYEDDARAAVDWFQHPIISIRRQVSQSSHPVMLIHDTDALVDELDRRVVTLTQPILAADLERIMVSCLALATFRYERDLSTPHGAIFLWAQRQFSTQALRSAALSTPAVRASLPPGSSLERWFHQVSLTIMATKLLRIAHSTGVSAESGAGQPSPPLASPPRESQGRDSPPHGHNDRGGDHVDATTGRANRGTSGTTCAGVGASSARSPECTVIPPSAATCSSGPGPPRTSLPSVPDVPTTPSVSLPSRSPPAIPRRQVSSRSRLASSPVMPPPPSRTPPRPNGLVVRPDRRSPSGTTSSGPIVELDHRRHGSSGSRSPPPVRRGQGDRRWAGSGRRPTAPPHNPLRRLQHCTSGCYVRLHGAPRRAPPVLILEDLRSCYGVPLPPRTVVLRGPDNLCILLLPHPTDVSRALATDLSFSSCYRLEDFDPSEEELSAEIRQRWVRSIRRVRGTHRVFDRV